MPIEVELEWILKYLQLVDSGDLPRFSPSCIKAAAIAFKVGLKSPGHISQILDISSDSVLAVLESMDGWSTVSLL